MIKTRKARQDLNDQLRSQGGLLGDLIIKKKQLGLDLLSAKTTEEIKKVNQELFRTNLEIKNIKEGGVKSFNSWGNALESFQFKFNTLGNLVGGFIGGLASGGLSLVVDGLKSVGGALVDFFTQADKRAELSAKQAQFDENEIENQKKLAASIKETGDKIGELNLKRAILLKNINAEQGKQIEANVQTISNLAVIEADFNKRQEKIIELARLSNTRVTDIIVDGKRQVTIHGGKHERELLDLVQWRIKAIEDAEKKNTANSDGHDKNLNDYKEYIKKLKKLQDDESNENFKIFGAQMKNKEEQNDFKIKMEQDYLLHIEKIQKDEAARLLKVEEDARKKREENSEKENKKRIDELQKQADREAAIRENLTDTLFAISKKNLGDSEADKKKREQIERLEQITELVNLFYKAYSSYLKAGDKGNVALRKASQDILGAKAFGAFIAGSFKEGTEDTGGAGNVDADGGKLAIIHPNERILTKEQNQALGGITNEDLVSRFNMFPKVPIMDESRSNTVAKAMLSLLDTRLQSLQKTIKDQERWNFERNAAEEMVLLNQRMGILNKTTFKNPSPSYSKH